MIVIIIILLVLSLIITVPTPENTFSFHTDAILESTGVISTEEYHNYGWWQDHTVYSKYTFENPNLENNEYLEQMSEEDIENFNRYIVVYEDWVDVISDDVNDRDLVTHYDFDKSIISINDYYYIYDYSYVDPDLEFEPEPCSFDLYFYDTETGILYYFHNNI